MNLDTALFTNTFSVAGRCEEMNAYGAIVATSTPAVGNRVPKCKNGIGAVLTQNMTDPRLADIGIAILEQGLDARSAVEAMKSATPYPEYRQLAAVDNHGGSHAFTGAEAYGPHHGQFCDKNVAAIGNYLSNPEIPEAMGKNFIENNGMYLPDRLLSAIKTGFQLGGEIIDERSMALVVYTDATFPYIDLRVDDSEDPLSEMKKLWEVWKEHADRVKGKVFRPKDYKPQ